MGIFRPNTSQAREQAPRVLMLPLTNHEVSQLLDALQAIRTGDTAAVPQRLGVLNGWLPVRLLSVLGIAAERYLRMLHTAGVIDLDADDAARRLLGRLRDAVPSATRIPEAAMFDALVVCLHREAPVVQDGVGNDIDAAVLGQLHLVAALCNLAASLPASTAPGVPEMLSGIVAPF